MAIDPIPADDLTAAGQNVAVGNEQPIAGNAEISPVQNEFVEANTVAYTAQVVSNDPATIEISLGQPQAKGPPFFSPPNPGSHIAVGGAVGGFSLGAWSIFAGFLTPAAMLNTLPGMVLSVWGLASSRKRLAQLAVLLNALGIVIGLVNMMGWLQPDGTNRNVPKLIDPDNPLENQSE